MVRKYGGIKWLDHDNSYHLCIGHPYMMFFQKMRGRNKYRIFATYQGYDLTKTPDISSQISMICGRKVNEIFMKR
jgi:hypothetical protein